MPPREAWEEMDEEDRYSIRPEETVDLSRGGRHVIDML
jgi:copper(I)-binding protein